MKSGKWHIITFITTDSKFAEKLKSLKAGKSFISKYSTKERKKKEIKENATE